MANIDLAKQQEALARLRSELEALDESFETIKGKMKISSEEELAVDPSQMTPELTQAMEQATARAASAGRNAVASMSVETKEPTASHRPRRGAISI